MATRLESLTDKHREFIDRQSMFFVATAAREGRVNVSPKGLDTLRVLGANRVVWLDLTGSGNETAAHLLRQNRMTIMFCAFEHEPLILRLYGRATEVQPSQPGWSELAPLFPALVGSRQIFDLDIDLGHEIDGALLGYADVGAEARHHDVAGPYDSFDRSCQKEGIDRH